LKQVPATDKCVVLVVQPLLKRSTYLALACTAIAGANPDATTSEGLTPLMMTFAGDVATCLCDAGANLSLHQDGLTALAYASAEGRPGVAKVLLERGTGTLEHIMKVSIKGFTPLSMAIAAGHEKIAVLLLQRLVQCTGFDISQPLPGLRKGLPLLAAAATKGMCELAEIALDSGALVNATGEYGSAAS
jgi:ankyrin repeat protein